MSASENYCKTHEDDKVELGGYEEVHPLPYELKPCYDSNPNDLNLGSHHGKYSYTTIGFYWDNGKENGSYHIIIGYNIGIIL